MASQVISQNDLDGSERAGARGGSGPKDERRRKNREYMRQWRRQPENVQRERENRTRYHVQRKLEGRTPVAPRKNLCAFCKLRKPVTTIRRLKPVPDGFAEVEMPYCGICGSGSEGAESKSRTGKAGRSREAEK